MSPEPDERGSGLLPFCWIRLLVILVSLEEIVGEVNGSSTTPTPTVLLLVTLLLRIVTFWPPTFRIPVPDGSSCLSSKNSWHPGGVPGEVHVTGGNGLGRLFLFTLLPSMSAVSVEVLGRPGRTITKMPAVLVVARLFRTTELFVFSSSMPNSPFVRPLFSTVVRSSSPT